MSLNPDPKKYHIRFRKGKPVLVDKQILRWRKKRAKLLAKTSLDAFGGAISDDQDVVKGKVAAGMENMFMDEMGKV